MLINRNLHFCILILYPATWYHQLVSSRLYRIFFKDDYSSSLAAFCLFLSYVLHRLKLQYSWNWSAIVGIIAWSLICFCLRHFNFGTTLNSQLEVFCFVSLFLSTQMVWILGLHIRSKASLKMFKHRQKF